MFLLKGALDPPPSPLDTLWDFDTPVCEWYGVTCDENQLVIAM
jgi:hypothetical protein